MVQQQKPWKKEELIMRLKANKAPGAGVLEKGATTVRDLLSYALHHNAINLKKVRQMLGALSRKEIRCRSHMVHGGHED